MTLIGVWSLASLSRITLATLHKTFDSLFDLWISTYRCVSGPFNISEGDLICRPLHPRVLRIWLFNATVIFWFIVEKKLNY